MSDVLKKILEEIESNSMYKKAISSVDIEEQKKVKSAIAKFLSNLTENILEPLEKISESDEQELSKIRQEINKNLKDKK